MTVARLCATALAAVASLAVALPAHADFYTLAGRFQCLDRANAVCDDAAPSVVVTPPAANPIDLTTVTPAAVKPKPPEAARAESPRDPILAISSRIQAGSPLPGDVGRLKEAARAGDSRAIELLAWCDYHGIGTRVDPVEAYLLYGRAAQIGVPHASTNQSVIYATILTGDQRQRIVDFENSRLPR